MRNRGFIGAMMPAAATAIRTIAPQVANLVSQRILSGISRPRPRPIARHNNIRANVYKWGTPMYTPTTQRNVFRKVSKLERQVASRRGIIEGNGATSVGTTITSQSLNLCSQGDTLDNRTGDRIFVTGVYVEGYMLFDTDNTTEYDWGKFVVIQDKDPEGAMAASTDVFANFQNINSQMNTDNKGRFQVLGQRIIQVNKHMQHGRFNIRIPFKMPLECRYNLGNAGTVADISKNHIFLMYFTGHNTTDQKAYVNYFWRTYFSS